MKRDELMTSKPVWMARGRANTREATTVSTTESNIQPQYGIILSVAINLSVDNYTYIIPLLRSYTMPRVTRKEKEQGKGKPKPKATTTATGRPDASQGRKRSSASGPPGAGKKTGFKVGPSHAPRDAYLGKGQYLLTCCLSIRYNI